VRLSDGIRGSGDWMRVMKKILVIASFFLAAGGITFAGFHMQQVGIGQRQPLTSRKGIPLSEIIKNGPKDVPVVVEKDQPSPLFVHPPEGTGQLEWIASGVPFVLIIRIEGMTPMLTSQRDWVTTTVRARVEQIIKKRSEAPLAVGQVIQFSQDGGEITLDGVRVKARVPWTESFQPGARYLVFAEYLGTPDLHISPNTSYEIDAHDTLKALALEGPATAETNLPLSSALTRIRALEGR